MAISPAVMSTFDEWDVMDNLGTEVKETVYLEYNANPLALVCAMIRNGKESYDIISTLQGVGTRPTKQIPIDNVIEREDEELADKIYKHFQQKYTMRRIKGEYISKFMLAVDDLCDNRCKIDKENLRVLVSMPRFYKENIELEALIKTHKSAPKPQDLTYLPMQGQVEFASKIHVKKGRANEYHYFWSTPNDYLMRIVVQKGHYGSEAWDLLAKHGKIHVSADITYTFNIKGYDFNVVQPSPEHMEIELV